MKTLLIVISSFTVTPEATFDTFETCDASRNDIAVSHFLEGGKVHRVGDVVATSGIGSPKYYYCVEVEDGS